MEKHSDSEEGIRLCESVVQGREIIPVLIANISNKTVKVQKGEEMGYASPLQRCVGIRKREKLGEIKEEIVVPERHRK